MSVFMNPKYAEPSPIHPATLERTGIDSSTSRADVEVVPAVEELRADVAAWADGMQAQVASWMEELRAEAVTWAEGLRAEALTRAGAFTAQLAVETDAIATLRASINGVNEATAAALIQTDKEGAQLRQELAALKSLVEERHTQRASDVEAARAAQADSLQVRAEAQRARNLLEAEVARLGAEVEELRHRLEQQAMRHDGKRSKQKKKAKR